MQIQILGQGYEPKSELSVGNQLIKFLSDKEFHSFTAIAAFASQAGVNGLSKHINEAKKHIANFTIVVGVNQKATSKEALDALNNLDINSYVFYAPPPFPIFHPKVYLFEGIDKSELIIGSSNITRPGLFSNVELSLLVSINNNIAEDIKIVTQLKEYFKGIFEGNDPNLNVITKELIADFVKDGIVPTEAEIKEEREKNKSKEKSPTESIISKIFPKREIAKIPVEFSGSPRAKIQQSSEIYKSEQPVEALELKWQKQLSQSDAQFVPNGTSPTNNLKLTQAKFKVNGKIIDQKTYFRDIVFKNLDWNKTKLGNSQYEETKCNFDITILGKNLSKQELKLSHDFGRVSGQANVPTWLHWNKILLPDFQENNITGKTLSLYSTNNSKEFKITIE